MHHSSLCLDWLEERAFHSLPCRFKLRVVNIAWQFVLFLFLDEDLVILFTTDLLVKVEVARLVDVLRRDSWQKVQLLKSVLIHFKLVGFFATRPSVKLCCLLSVFVIPGKSFHV